LELKAEVDFFAAFVRFFLSVVEESIYPDP
jgi:hypothetical protein